MLPPNAVAELGPERWGENFTLVDLIGKAANICGELPENGMITGSIFKQVVEGEPVRAEFKGQEGFVFTPECAHWFASNRSEERRVGKECVSTGKTWGSP